MTFSVTFSVLSSPQKCCWGLRTSCSLTSLWYEDALESFTDECLFEDKSTESEKNLNLVQDHPTLSNLTCLSDNEVANLSASAKLHGSPGSCF